MKPSDDLFQLIQRMSPFEKRSFNLYTQRYRDSEKKYLQLFEAIRKQKKYSEEAIKKAVQKEIKPDNFASAKNYLWNLINDFLIFHSQENYQIEKCRRHLDRAHLLHKRGIVNAAKRELKAGKKIAAKYELIQLQIQINQLERNMLKRYQRKKIGEKMRELIGKRLELRRARNALETQNELYDRLAVYMRSNLSQLSATEIDDVESIADHPDLALDNRPEGFNALRFYLQSICFIHHVRRSLKSEFKGYQELYSLWKAHPHQKAELYVEFRLFLCNYLHSAAQNGHYDLFPDILDQLDALPIENEEDEIEAFSVGLFYRHLLAMNNKDLEKALLIGKDVPGKLTRFGDKISDSTRLGFQANLLFTNFLAGNYQEAKTSAIQLQTQALTQHRVDLQGLSRLIEIITTYELVDDGQYEYVLSRIKAVSEWLRRHKLANSFEKAVLNHLNRLIQNEGTPKGREILVHLKQEIDSIAVKGHILGLEEIHYWTKSKLLGVSISDVFVGRINLDI